MVASDGGVFAFGDTHFAGSMGGQHLNTPLQSVVLSGLAVDDRLETNSASQGYWLVVADGGIFAFGAPFRGSLGNTPLNQPITGMVRYGDGYLMVDTNGASYNFSSLPFSGSPSEQPPNAPVVAVAAVPFTP
jgi:hypothetical protein